MDRASSKVKVKALLGLGQLLVVMGLVVFLTAGTWRYVEGWAFLLVFGASALAITLYLMRNDPRLLEQRVKAGPVAEQRPLQKMLQALASLGFLAVLAVPALDHRLSWSHVPLIGNVLGEVLVGTGFWIVFLVFRENSFASAIIQVDADQKLIDTGPYARVRHPMYAGALILLAGTPLALGSWWGLIALAPLIAVIVSRLLDEEAVLVEGLAGYAEYRQRTRYRLIPRVW
jgi:protein-S-isoprenylcysteine O-methyltransferase Ste14